MALMVDNNYEGILLSLDSQKSVPAPFLTKTYQLVDDPNTDRIVSWGDDESTFVVWRPPEFARDLLPNYFKHSNFSSFVRQLNTYGFRKIVPERWEFANEFFRKGEKHLLCEIHRRRSAQPQTAVNHHHHLTGQTYFHYPTRLSISPPDSDESQQPITSNNWCDSPPPLLSPSAAAIGSVTALSEDNERLRRNNNKLVSELAHMRRLYDDIIYFVQNHVKPVYPSDSYSSSLFLRNSSSKEPCSHVNYANPIRDNRVLGSFNTNYSSSSSPTGNILPTIIDELGNNFEQPNNCRTKLFGVPLVSKKRLHPECNSFSSVGTMTNKTGLVSENNGDDGYLGLNLMPPSSC